MLFLQAYLAKALFLFAKMEQMIYGRKFRGREHSIEKRFSFGWGRRTVRG